MDDLNGLDWSSGTRSSKPTAPTASNNYYASIPSLRPTPPPQSSGRNTPLSAQASGAPRHHSIAKTATPDSFSNLVSFGSSKQGKLTLQEQQEKLQEEKRNQEADKRKQLDAQFGTDKFWDGFESQRSATNTPPISSSTALPAVNIAPATVAHAATSAGVEDDLFAAFNKDAKVDSSTHFPPTLEPSSGKNTPGLGNHGLELNQPQAWEQPSNGFTQDSFNDDDDPFGLRNMKQHSRPAVSVPTANDDEDFLGDLGKPVEEIKKTGPAMKEVAQQPDQESEEPWDKAVAELVDMGFSAEQSRRALIENGSGLDIQAAVGWLLNDAHREAKQKQQVQGRSRSNGSSNREIRESSRDGQRKQATPAWMRDERSGSQSRPEESRSASGDADLSKTAAAVGSNLFKSANSFWKTSQQKVQKAVAEFQQESEPNQPKWMREAAERDASGRKAAAEGRGRKVPAAANVTDEALMLEGDGRPPPRAGKAIAPESRLQQSANSSREQSPAMPTRPTDRPNLTPRWQSSTTSDPRSRMSKQATEEQSAQAYISPARRKKATAEPTRATEPDLLFSSLSSQPQKTKGSLSKSSQQAPPISSRSPAPITTRATAPPRNTPSLSSAALQSSTQHRLIGTQHFKRGDYASAHQSYSSSLSSLPENHPIAIILLCNRALTGLKTGVPKEAISDSDKALDIIGLSRGERETINLGNSEGGGAKQMKEYYGKALSRKAEALEQMEKWVDARDVWKIAVEHGVGGPTAIQGRVRCEKALAPKPRISTPQARPPPRPKPQSALGDLNGTNGLESVAVKRLRDANVAAEKADDEKFALSDKVDSKVAAWRDGKRDNLRALLGSLENVMWEGSEWKKIGMGDLVMNGKVKINYMKAIGKCHPDKLPQDASTEVIMIAGLVFATLNESWDKFKQQNGM